MKDRMVYMGLDAGSNVFHVVALDTEGTRVLDREFDTSESNVIVAVEQLREKVSKKTSVHVHLEATELAPWIRRVLRPRVSRVVAGDPRSSAWIARDAHKHDRLDAFKRADLLRMGRAHKVYYPEDDHRTVFKQIVQHYDDLTRQKIRLKQKIKAQFRAQGVLAKGLKVYGEAGRDEWLRQVKAAPAREGLQHLYSLLEATEQAREKARKLMLRKARRYREIKLFQEVPGVGPVGACRFSAYIRTPHRFSNKRKLWTYCRLGVTDRSSDGKPLGRRRLDWNGNGALKAMSHQALLGAMQTKKENMFRRAFRRSLNRTHDSTHARLSTQRKILAVLRAIRRTGRSYDDSKG